MVVHEEDAGTWTSVRLTARERELVGQVARREHRKIAQQIRVFIYEGLERRGLGEKEATTHV